jgi:hypothetical protein
VSLLPEEFGAAKERTGRLFPADDEHHWLYIFGKSR